MDVINGYICKNCTEVDLAKKGIDPAHPKDGPYGRDKVRAATKAAEADAVKKEHVRAATGSVGRTLDVSG